jgi:hypothetical protein
MWPLIRLNSRYGSPGKRAAALKRFWRLAETLAYADAFLAIIWRSVPLLRQVEAAKPPPADPH